MRPVASAITAAIISALFAAMPTTSTALELPGGWHIELDRVVVYVASIPADWRSDFLTRATVAAWGLGFDDLDDLAATTCSDIAARNNEIFGDGTAESPLISSPRYLGVSYEWGDDGMLNRIGVTCQIRQTWTEDETIHLACGETRYSAGWPMRAGSWYSSRSAWDCSYYSSIERTNGSYTFYGPVVLEDQARSAQGTICQELLPRERMWPGSDGEARVGNRTCADDLPDWSRVSRTRVKSAPQFAFMDRGPDFTRRRAVDDDHPCVAAINERNAQTADEGRPDLVGEAVNVLAHPSVNDDVTICSSSYQAAQSSGLAFDRHEGGIICVTGTPGDNNWRWAIRRYLARVAPTNLLSTNKWDALASCLEYLEEPQ